MITEKHTHNIACWVDETPLLTSEIIALLRKQAAFPRLIRDWVLDRTVAEITIEKEEQRKILNEYRSNNKLIEEEEYLNYLQDNHLDEELLLKILLRPHQIVKYRENRWGAFAQSLYLQQKERFDLVSYNRLESTNAEVMQEIYFRLKDNEESWDGLARQFPGAPANAKALQGPVPVADVEGPILKVLRESEPGRVARPIRYGNQVIVVALDKFHPSTLDDYVRIELLKGEFDEWLGNECNKMLKNIRFSE